MESHERKLVCRGCGASLEYSAGARALKCAYCATVTEIPAADEETLTDTPALVVPMTVTRAQLEDAVYQHLAAGEYTPDKLLEFATFSKVEQFYVPAYLFFGRFDADWSASFGYNRTEHYTDYERDSKGNSRPVSNTRTVTDWRPASGTDTGEFAVVTYAGNRLQQSALPVVVNLVEGCHGRAHATRYDISYTSGVEVEAFSVKETDAYQSRGENLINLVVDSSVKQHAQGNHQANWHWTASTNKQCSTLILPVCRVVYEYEGKAYEVWTDGTTTANLVADASPEDNERKKAVRAGFIPGVLAALSAGGLIFFGREHVGHVSPGLMLTYVGSSLLYGVGRRDAILSYSRQLRQALLAQKKLAATDTSRLTEDEQKKLLAACERPSRPMLSITTRDKLLLPIMSVVAVGSLIAPPRSQGTTETAGTPAVVAAPTAPVAAVAPPQPAPQPQQMQAAQSLAPASQQSPSQAAILPQNISAILQFASAGDWAEVDFLTERLQRRPAPFTGSRDPAAAQRASIEGNAALKRGDHEKAIQAYQQGLKADPLSLELLNSVGYALEEGGHHVDALRVLTEVLRRAPQSTPVWGNISFSLAELGYAEQAKAAGMVALHYSPHREQTLESLRQVSKTGRSSAIREMGAAVVKDAQSVNTPIPMGARSASEEASMRKINQQLDQQLQELNIQR